MLSEAVAAFTSYGVPVRHVRFRKYVEPPYATAHLQESLDDFADDRNLRSLCTYDITLSVVDRDLALEASVEDALAEADITWRKSGGYDPDHDLLTTTYRMNVYER